MNFASQNDYREKYFSKHHSEKMSKLDFQKSVLIPGVIFGLIIVFYSLSVFSPEYAGTNDWGGTTHSINIILNELNMKQIPVIAMTAHERGSGNLSECRNE